MTHKMMPNLILVLNHVALSQRAIDASNSNNFLTSMLPFDFSNPTAIDSVRGCIAKIGAKHEDKPDIRSPTSDLI